MAKGIRIPVGDPDLGDLLRGVQEHADWELARPATRWRFEEVIEQYNARDQQLYELADRIGGKTTGILQDAPELHSLLAALQKHSKWRLRERPFRHYSLEGCAKERAEEDHELYDVAALARLTASQRSSDPGICLDPESLKAVLAGRKTVMRYPIELNVHDKRLGSHFRVGGGRGGSYALWMLPNDGSSELQFVPGNRLRIVDVEIQPLGNADNYREARLEGFEDPTTSVQTWWGRHGHQTFKWSVWRYEFEVISL
jgi:hypothetical protein